MKVELKLNEKQGHWILAKAGKKVLRPGGRELTNRLINNMKIHREDDVVEFAPGLGFTAALTCAKKPRSYTGIDNNKEASELAAKNVKYQNMRMIVSDAANTTLPDDSVTKVYGEAMLTMQSKMHKKEIIREANRILKKGGYYGIHEMGLQPNNISDKIKKNVYKEISANIRVPARPLTTSEWVDLLESENFKVVKVMRNPMHLLEPKRVLQDEGFFGTLKILSNIIRYSELRKSIFSMRRTFKKHEKHIDSIAIVAQKL